MKNKLFYFGLSVNCAIFAIPYVAFGQKRTNYLCTRLHCLGARLYRMDIHIGGIWHLQTQAADELMNCFLKRNLQ